ncbi:ribonuclease HII [Rubneribacter sp.]|nr:ribonuclease HII [Candidatus Rubneribacter avistercoris]
MGTTVADIKRRLQSADEDAFEVLERSLVADTRKGVRDAVEAARRRLEAEAAERARLEGLYAFEHDLAASHGGRSIAGLDEAGRGPLAGPLAVGAVILPAEPRIEGLDDSKRLAPAERERVAERVKEQAVAWAVEYVEACDIDACGMAASLVTAFRRALARVEEAAGIAVDVVLVDGNPLRMDAREVNVVKGDARCASIAAASIVAKVERDAVMLRYAEEYPEYGFDSCKGYASPAHIEAIRRHGLTPIHRASFCTAFTQPTLF